MNSIRSLTLVVLVAAVANAQQAAWTQLNISGPSPRASAGIVFDSARQEFVLFGGRDTSSVFGDTWVFRSGTWIQLSPTPAPAAREGHSFVFDPVRGVSVLFGGTDSNQFFRDTWEWNGSRWIPFPFANPPRARAWHSSCFDPTTGGVMVNGGADGASQGPTFRVRDTWTWNGQAWSASSFWSYAVFGAATYSPTENAVLVDGGLSINASCCQALRHSSWVRGGGWVSSLDRFYSGLRHSLLFDSHYGAILKIGGEIGDAALGGPTSPVGDEVYILRSGSQRFERLSNLTPGPARTIGSAIARDEGTRDILVFGGEDRTGGVSGETWLLRVDPVRGTTRSFGTGCPASNPFSLTAVTGDPQIGRPVVVQVSNFASLPAIFAVRLGVSDRLIGGFPLPLSLDPYGMTGCFVYHSFDDAGQPASATYQSELWSLPIPNLRVLIGTSLFLQAVGVAPGVNPLGVTTSNGVELVFGG